jgi:hypothetical protein
LGTGAPLPSWKDLQTDFLQYAVEHADLCAVWRWMYEDPEESAEPQAPQGHWTLEGGFPGSQHIFRVIAGRAASRLSNPSDAEPWRLWLDRMRAESYTRDLAPRRVSMQHIRNLGALGQIGRPLPPGFKNQHIEQVFRASADYCFARSLAEETGESCATGLDGSMDRFADRGTEIIVPRSGPAGPETDTSRAPDQSDSDRGKTRSAWVDAKRACLPRHSTATFQKSRSDYSTTKSSLLQVVTARSQTS